MSSLLSANARDGCLLLGVQDGTREVTGIPIEHLDDVEALVRQACEDSMSPPLAPHIGRATLPDSQGTDVPVIRIEVSRSLSIHRSPGGTFIVSVRRNGRFSLISWRVSFSSVAKAV